MARIFTKNQLYGFLWVALGIFLSPSSVHALSAPPLTLDQCYTWALKQSETLQIQTEAIDQAERRYRQAFGSILPHLDFVASEFFQEKIERSNSRGDRIDPLHEQPELKFTLRQPLFSGFREFAAMAGYEAQQERERKNLTYASKLLLMDVARAFYMGVQSDRTLENLDILIKLNSDRVKELKERIRLGKSRESEILTVEAQLELRRAQRIRVEQQKYVVESLLSFLTGQDLENVIFQDNIPMPSSPGATQDFYPRVENRSDVQADAADVNVAKHDLSYTKGSGYPTADAEGNYYLKRKGVQEDVDWDVLLKLDVPLYQGGTQKAEVREAESRLRVAALRLEQTRRDARREIRDAVRQLDSSLREINRLELAYEKAEKSYQLQAKEYRFGLVDNLEVLAAMNNMQEQKQSLDEAIAQSKLNWLELGMAIEELPSPFELIKDTNQ